MDNAALSLAPAPLHQVACTNWKRLMIILSESVLQDGVAYTDPQAIPRSMVHNLSSHLTFSKFRHRYGKFSHHLMKVSKRPSGGGQGATTRWRSWCHHPGGGQGTTTRWRSGCHHPGGGQGTTTLVEVRVPPPWGCFAGGDKGSNSMALFLTLITLTAHTIDKMSFPVFQCILVSFG